MQTTYIRHQLDLYRAKIAVLAAMAVCLASPFCHAQKKRWMPKNNPNYDERKLTYGFLIGLHTTAYQLQYSDRFVTPSFDTVHAVEPAWYPGFSLGFIVNYRVADLLDLRMTPKVAFYEHRLRYFYTDDTPTEEQAIETTMVEFPLLLKYKSERRGNIRMYMVGGIKPAIEASGKNRIENATSELEVKGGNLHLDFGFGFDLYYPLFKFSPEIRFSKGLINILDNTSNQYGQPIDRLNTNTITVYFLFQ